MKILFVSTKKNLDPTERELYEMDLLCEVLGFSRSLLDLGLLTIAGCTPDRFRLSFQDEYLGPLDYDEEADLVALSAKTSCSIRAYAAAAEFRRRGRTVVLGGIHASLRPEEALEHVDCIVTGEAEEIWPQVLADLEKGELKQRYDSVGFPPMSRIPFPRFANLDPADFLFHQIQSTRGCPYRCRFCSVPDISGQAFRFKPVARLREEVAALPRRGRLVERMKSLYVVDDNFLSRPAFTKELLQDWRELRRQGLLPDWSAETTLNVAMDEELLDLFRQAGCTTLILGLESVSEKTLQSVQKGINFCLTYPEALERIHARGLSVVGNFIVGFDTDDLSTFQATRDFVFDNNILYPFFSVLTPMPGTELHDEMAAEGRLLHTDWSRYDTRHVVFRPRNMSVDQLLDGYVWLFEQCYRSDAAWANLQRSWRRPERWGSRWAERAWVRWRLARSRRLSSSGRAFARRAFRWMTQPGCKGDVAQLLYYLDSGHFAEFLHRYRSPHYAHHAEQFESGVSSSDARQWESKRARRAAPSANDQSRQRSTSSSNHTPE